MSTPNAEVVARRRLGTGSLILGLFNLLFGFFYVISPLGLYAPKRMPEESVEKLGEEDPDAVPVMEALRSMDDGTLLFLSTTAVAIGGLLVVSGYGLLRKRFFLGRVLASICAVANIVYTVGSPYLMPEVVRTQDGGPITVGLIGKLIYPVLTLLIVNTTLRPLFRPAQTETAPS